MPESKRRLDKDIEHIEHSVVIKVMGSDDEVRQVKITWLQDDDGNKHGVVVEAEWPG